MTDVTSCSLGAYLATNWLEIVKAAAPLVTAFIAFRALKNWKRQDRAKREIEFLDLLVETMHSYIVEMQRPIELSKFAKIGMASNVNSYDEDPERYITGAIAFIKTQGEDLGERFAAVLIALDTKVAKLHALSAKGQMFKFKDYKKCQDAINLLTWHHGRLASFNSMISYPAWNWDHEDVLGSLRKVMEIEPNEMRESIGLSNIAMIEFAQQTYKRAYD